MEKSKATQAFVTLRSLQTAFNAYFVANGHYPFKFDEVDISLPHMTGHVEQLSSSNVKDTISDKDWSLQIQQDTPTSGAYHLIMMTRISGDYKGAGFQVRLYSPSSDNNTILCIERKESANYIFSKTLGSYCKGIMKGKYSGGNAYQDNYSL